MTIQTVINIVGIGHSVYLWVLWNLVVLVTGLLTGRGTWAWRVGLGAKWTEKLDKSRHKRKQLLCFQTLTGSVWIHVHSALVCYFLKQSLLKPSMNERKSTILHLLNWLIFSTNFVCYLCKLYFEDIILVFSVGAPHCDHENIIFRGCVIFPNWISPVWCNLINLILPKVQWL